eukprot:1445142-Rhodomonas_salina.1
MTVPGVPGTQVPRVLMALHCRGMPEPELEHHLGLPENEQFSTSSSTTARKAVAEMWTRRRNVDPSPTRTNCRLHSPLTFLKHIVPETSQSDLQRSFVLGPHFGSGSAPLPGCSSDSCEIAVTKVARKAQITTRQSGSTLRGQPSYY